MSQDYIVTQFASGGDAQAAWSLIVNETRSHDRTVNGAETFAFRGSNTAGRFSCNCRLEGLLFAWFQMLLRSFKSPPLCCVTVEQCPR